MAFAKFQEDHRRMWALIGPANSGKSTFVAAMKDPVVVIDPDGRFNDVAEMMTAAGQEAYSLSDKPADHHDPLAIQKALEKNMPKADVGTIALDSMTSLLHPLVTRIMMEIEKGMHKNKAAAWRPKAELVRLITHSMAKWGTDVVYIYHEEDHRDNRGQAETRRTVSELEESRMLMNLTARVRLDQDKDGRYAEVIWSRTGRTGQVRDTEGMWNGVPEEIDALVWENLTETEQAIADGDAPPETFSDPQAAITWGFAQGPFKDMQHAKNAYNKVKEEQKPKNALDMRDAWVADVERRVKEEPEVKAYNAPDGVVYECPDCGEPVPDDGDERLLECEACGVIFNPDVPPVEEHAEVISITAPDVFEGPEVAIAWAMELGVFTTEEVAKATYQAIRGLSKVTNAKEMRDTWVTQILELIKDGVQAVGVTDNGPIVQELELKQEVVEPGKWPEGPTVPDKVTVEDAEAIADIMMDPPEAPPPIDEAPPEVPF